ncbi:MAG: cell wall hydrolase [Eubacterium sp.]|nr:cell wall hydrolase [Eubacterium sp.]
MKRRILTLFLLVFVLSASSMIAVSAADETVSQEVQEESTETTTATIDEETTTVKKQVIKVKKTVKVNKTLKLKKSLSFTKKKLKKYTFKSSKPSVATVSEKGVVTAVKAGKTTIKVYLKKNHSLYAKVTVKVKNRYTKSQLRLMSSIIFCEAGAESTAGKRAVGIVVMNRVKSGLFPNTLSGVIYQRGQFTPARTGFLSKALWKYDSGRIPQACINAAKDTLNGEKNVNLSGNETDMSKFLFFSRYLAGCRLKIGGHQFK